MNLSDCICDGSEGPLERVRYFSRQLLDAHDLTDDQAYHRAKRSLHNRLLHGWGIICGLEVKKNPASAAPLNVTICPGYALSPQGEEIYVPMDIQFDIGRCIVGQTAPCHSPCAPLVPGAVDPTNDFYIAIRYIECPSRPVRVSPIGCGCDDTACEYSRIRDGFEVTCLGSLPDSHLEASKITDVLCSAVNETKVIACPPSSKSPWIVLAQVHINGTVLDTPSFDCRRVLISTAVIQEHLRAQCG